jgi:hypothetical protein
MLIAEGVNASRKFSVSMRKTPDLDRSSGDRSGVYRSAVLAIAFGLAACADPVAEQAKRDHEAARLNVLGDAVFYWQCTHKAVQQAGECRRWSETYERDKAAFMAKYGAPDAAP